jgi:hypothetical protein
MLWLFMARLLSYQRLICQLIKKLGTSTFCDHKIGPETKLQEKIKIEGKNV